MQIMYTAGQTVMELDNMAIIGNENIFCYKSNFYYLNKSKIQK